MNRILLAFMRSSLGQNSFPLCSYRSTGAPEIKLFRRLVAESCLIVVAGVWALLDFKHFDLLEDLKAVAASSQQDHITGFEYPALEVVLFVIVEIDAQF